MAQETQKKQIQMVAPNDLASMIWASDSQPERCQILWRVPWDVRRWADRQKLILAPAWLIPYPRHPVPLQRGKHSDISISFWNWVPLRSQKLWKSTSSPKRLRTADSSRQERQENIGGNAAKVNNSEKVRDTQRRHGNYQPLLVNIIFSHF